MMLEDHSGDLSAELLSNIEADSYWGLDTILSRIQDNYTFDQKGITTKLDKMERMMELIDPELSQHIRDNDIIFLQFAFRWINCCLLREFPLQIALRLWDAYISIEDGTGFSDFNIYCCVALLVHFKPQLLEMDFSEMLQFLQHLPTKDWTEQNIQVLVSQAFIFQTNAWVSH